MTVKSRIYGLDLARALLLLGGPLIHAVLAGHDPLALQTIAQGSHLFRMAAFFAISGYLIALTTQTYKHGWLLNRMRQLGVPLVTVSLLLWGIHIMGVKFFPTIHLPLDAFPLHLWFIISLIVMSPMTLVVDRIGMSDKIVGFLDRFNALLLPLGIIGAAAGYIGAAAGHEILRQLHFSLNTTIDSAIFNTLKHLPFYLFGFFLARSEQSRIRLDNKPVIIMGLVIWIIGLIYFTQLGGLDLVYGERSNVKNGMTMITKISEVWISLSIILVALKVKSVPSPILRFSKSAYSIYLFHLPFILIAAYVIYRYFPSTGDYTRYAIMVVFSLVMSYWTHLFIKKSDVLMFLFNGTKNTKIFAITTHKGNKNPDKSWYDTFVFVGYVPVMRVRNEEGSQENQWLFCRMMYTRMNSGYRRLWMTPKVHATKPPSLDPTTVSV